MDNDQLTDGEEIFLGTCPSNNDTDSDDLSDFEEVLVYQTNPLEADTDGDGVDDGQEIVDGTDPLDPTDFSSSKSGGLDLPFLLFTTIVIAMIIKKKRK